jgi:Fe-S cluster assembly protein SufD
VTTGRDGTTGVTVALTGGLALLEREANHEDPAWLTGVRRSASDWVHAHGFPTRKNEDWRYTRLEPILAVAFERASPGLSHQRALRAINGLGAGLGGARLVFVNGHFAPELSRVGELPDGATVTNLASVLAEGDERLEPIFSRTFAPFHHAFAALNTALTGNGAFVSLAANTVVEAPIELVFFSETDGAPLVSNPRSVVLAGPGSQATIVETHTGLPGEIYCTNAVTEVVLEPGAVVEHYKIQDEADSAFHLALLDVRQDRESHFSSHVFALGSHIARHEVRVCLEGEGADVNLDGLYLPRGDQLHDNPVLVVHAAPRGTSRQLYKGVVDEHGHGVFNGHIVVRPGASGTDARQTNKNLLLSDDAEIDTRPRLEILTDDVKCAHGAAVGRLDEDALFYLRSRGVPAQMARAILTYAFAREMVDLIPLEPLRARVEELVADRIGTSRNERAT